MNNLRRLQLIELELLHELDKICRKHNLRYFLAAGTLLGAVRHKGFIPWDDDIDVSMPLADYQKFCQICETELDGSTFFLQTMDTDPHYRYIFAKLRRQDTLYLRKGQEHMKHHHGICIDIFPWYPVPKGSVAGTFFEFVVARCKTIMWSPVGAVSEKKILLKLLYKLLSRINIAIPRGVIEWLVSKCSPDISADIGEPFYGNSKVTKKRMTYVNEPISTIRQKLQVRELIEMEFEGINFFVPANYDYILTYWYGDYMELPPVDKRVGHHHASIIDFGNALEGEN